MIVITSSEWRKELGPAGKGVAGDPSSMPSATGKLGPQVADILCMIIFMTQSGVCAMQQHSQERVLFLVRHFANRRTPFFCLVLGGGDAMTCSTHSFFALCKIRLLLSYAVLRVCSGPRVAHFPEVYSVLRK